MKTLGITGGIGSGKSTVTAMLRDLGAPVFDADLEARRIMEDDPDVRRAIAAAFGDDAYDHAGRLNRPFLAARVFGDDAAVQRLNSIVHPRVHEAFRRTRDDAQVQGVPVLVYEAALIFESGGDRLLDAVAVVDAPEEVRIARTMARDESTREQVVARMRHQISPAEARRRADYVIENGTSRDALRVQVEKLFRAVTESAQ